MGRTSKNTKAVTVATVAETAVDAEIRSVGDVLANVIAAVPTPGAAAEAASVEATETDAASGETAFLPLNKLKKSPRNARKRQAPTEC